MPKLPVVSGKKVIKALSKIGFVHVRTRGSHFILTRHSAGAKVTVPVPFHKELAKGTLKSIMKKASVTLEDLLKLLD